MIVNGCPDCAQLTGGACNRHAVRYFPDPQADAIAAALAAKDEEIAELIKDHILSRDGR